MCKILHPEDNTKENNIFRMFFASLLGHIWEVFGRFGGGFRDMSGMCLVRLVERVLKTFQGIWAGLGGRF